MATDGDAHPGPVSLLLRAPAHRRAKLADLVSCGTGDSPMQGRLSARRIAASFHGLVEMTGQTMETETNNNTTTANSSAKPHAVVWIAGIAVTAFSLAGIAAIMGWIPTSMGKQDATVIAKVEPSRTAASARARSETPAAPRAKPTLAAVSVPVAVPKAVCDECGVIETVRTVDTKGEGSGIGAVGGAVVGAVVGNQIGHGTGKAVATVVGAVGGGYAGNQVEKYVKAGKSYEIVVRLENGSSRTFSQATAPAWHTGDRVRIVDGVLHSNS